jgi:uncharacterized membrane protein YdbT with pleckstrin-like domain
VFSSLLRRVLLAKEIFVTEASFGMSDEVVWRGTSSQWKDFGGYLLCGLFCWLIVPLFFALARYLQTKCKILELTTQRFKTTSGVFSKVTETLELYRVKDIETRQPFLSRLAGVENVQMNTSDLVAACLDRSCSVEHWTRGQITESSRDHSATKTGA